MDIKKILIIGCGTMGYQIALQFAMHGFGVNLYDIKEDALKDAMKNIESMLDSLIESGYCKLPKDKVMGLITPTTDKAVAAKDVDLINESILEDPVIKGKVFSEFNALCPPHTIFTTNTSSLIASEIAGYTGRPEKFLCYHFGNPVWLENLADVMPHKDTDPEVVETVCELSRKIRQVPLKIMKEQSGYLTNCIMWAYVKAASDLLLNGVASHQDIDRACMVAKVGHVPPFALLDLMSLDTSYYVLKKFAEKGNEGAGIFADYLYENYVNKGKLGKKSGEGFYKYPNPEFEQEGFI